MIPASSLLEASRVEAEFRSNARRTAVGGRANMATPFKKIDGDVLALTNAVCSDRGGWTSEHADWLCREGNAASVRQFMDERMAAGVQSSEPEIEIMASGYTGPFAKERAKGPYLTYPKGWEPKDPRERAKILAPHFPGLDFSHVEELVLKYVKTFPPNPRRNERRMAIRELPDDADSGLIVVPKLEAVARLVKKQPNGWKPLNLAIRYLFEVLKEVRDGFHDYTEAKEGPEYVRLLAVTERMLAHLGSKTPGDVLVLPAQTGLLFAGYNTVSSRGHMGALKRHIPMHDFAGGCLALTDPERFVKGTLCMECGGTERTTDDANGFVLAPIWSRSSEGWIAYGDSSVYGGYPSCGSASFVL